MLFEIKNRFSGELIFNIETTSMKLCVKAAIKASADLRSADLSSADLSYANLSYANLRSADLSSADLSYADLSYANLSYANLRSANLSSADLRSADLSYADLSSADLRSANLSSAKNIIFQKFPSISLLAGICFHNLPDELNLELMRRDVQCHPKPELFEAWASGGSCPYSDVERFWLFDPKRELWKPGVPQMSDVELIIALCKSQGFGIKGYLEIKKNK